MTRFPSLRLTLAAALLAASTTTPAAPAVTFDTTPRAGQHQRQIVDMQMTVTSRVEAGPGASDEQRVRIQQMAEQMARTGAMKMTLQMEQTLRVGRADADGWLPLELGVLPRGGQFEVGGETRAIPPEGTPKSAITARFNPRDFGYEIVRVQGSTALTETLRQQASGNLREALQLYKSLAQRPMKVGDSVEVPMKLPMPIALPGTSGNLDSAIRYTLVRVERGVAHFDLTMDLNATADIPVPQKPAAAASAASAAAAPAGVLRMQARGTGKGTSSLRLSDRLPLATRLDLDMQVTMQGPDETLMNADMKLAMTSQGENLTRSARKAKR